MRSMTGYGRGEGDNGALNIVIEVKAVNHRYSEITIKQPRQFLALEDKIDVYKRQLQILQLFL